MGAEMPRKYVPKGQPPLEVRQERSRKGAAVANSTGNLVKRLVARAEEITPEQRAALLEALKETTKT